MSTNAENNDKIGVDHNVAGEQTSDSIGSQAKSNQEHQKKEIAAKTPTPPATSTATVTRNTTQELQTKTKKVSTLSNTDLTQTNGNKSGGMLKRFSTVMKGFNLANRNRPQQGRDNDLNEQHEDIKSQSQDNSATDSQPRPEQGEKTPGQHRATDLPQNNGDFPAAQDSVRNEQPADLLSTTTKVGDSTEQQQDQHQDDFVRVESPEPDKVSKHEEEIASLKNLLADHTTEIASLKESMVKNNNAIASLKAQLSPNVPSSPTPNDKVRETEPVLRVGEVTTSPIQERPGDGLVFRKADGISLTEVANLVRELNAQIDQAASLIMDLLTSRESSSSSKDSSIAWDELHDYLGSWLCDELQRTSEEPEIDQTVAHIALQAGLVHACSRIINDWNPPFWADGEAFSRVYDNMARVEGLAITADTWRALARNHMALREDQLEANKKYLEDVLLKLIIAVSGSLQSGDTLLQQCDEKVDDIARKAIDIHRVVSREARSTDLSTFTVESGTEFDQSRMEDTEESSSEAGPAPPSKVVCTVEMGLRGRKRVPSRQQSGDGRVGSVTLKAKVVLPATLGGEL
ncbi:hypothetical protein M378DRAFT_198591 [Amanita muscaria Koide BX008]|uniref:Uncharacterized protein n=1 Tax=Amanita muscaria (strain Koide BX008) TaxID=946122 RepID=A0A0C2X5M1_AMAMK|nr:hypothetical protein M378DRAFT_198591 [Amanita muscaria Koide BX008]